MQTICIMVSANNFAVFSAPVKRMKGFWNLCVCVRESARVRGYHCIWYCHAITAFTQYFPLWNKNGTILISNISWACLGKMIFIHRGLTHHCSIQMVHFRWKMSVKSNYIELWSNLFTLSSVLSQNCWIFLFKTLLPLIFI